jgi:hypothetical protein
VSLIQPISGRCLCGAVTIAIHDFDGHVGACHCGMCRRWNGGPSFTVGGNDIRIAGEEHIRSYSSSEWAERAFCEKCGTHLFYRMKGTGQRHVWAGLFDGLPDARLESEIYIDHKPGWYAFANETHKMTEAEVIAQYAPASQETP